MTNYEDEIVRQLIDSNIIKLRPLCWWYFSPR
jgi:hypothetical protein